MVVIVPSMSDTAFSNVVGGELVPAASGETYDVLDPTTGEVYATAPRSGEEDVSCRDLVDALERAPAGGPARRLPATRAAGKPGRVRR